MARQPKKTTPKASDDALVMGVGETSQDAVIDSLPAAPDGETVSEPVDPRLKSHTVIVGDTHVTLGVITH